MPRSVLKPGWDARVSRAGCVEMPANRDGSSSTLRKASPSIPA
jgi:hypothetical protein